MPRYEGRLYVQVEAADEAEARELFTQAGEVAIDLWVAAANGGAFAAEPSPTLGYDPSEVEEVES